MFFGGLGGPFHVSMSIICPSYIGFLAFNICLTLGSLIMSIVLDYTDPFGITDTENLVEIHTSPPRIFGVVTVFIGAILVNVTWPNNRLVKISSEEIAS